MELYVKKSSVLAYNIVFVIIFKCKPNPIRRAIVLMLWPCIKALLSEPQAVRHCGLGSTLGG
jgi:hypothetical protein